jgi:hypothetical protein
MIPSVASLARWLLTAAPARVPMRAFICQVLDDGRELHAGAGRRRCDLAEPGKGRGVGELVEGE